MLAAALALLLTAPAGLAAAEEASPAPAAATGEATAPPAASGEAAPPATGSEAAAPAAAAPAPAGTGAAPVLAVPTAAEATPEARAALLQGRTKVLDGLVAVVDGDPMTLVDLRSYARTATVFLPPESRSDFQAILASMIEKRLLKAEFDKNGIKISDEMVDRYIQGVFETNHQNRAQVEKALEASGLVWDDYHERMRDEVARLSLVNMQIRSRVNVTPEEIERTWKNDPGFVQSEKLEIAQIYLPLPNDPDAAAAVRAQAAEVKAAADSNFAAAAKKYSKGPTAAEGGTLGQFERGTMAPHFEKALAGLSEGDVSEVVEGGGGLQIVKILDIQSKGRRPLEEVSEQIKEKLYETRLEERYQKWVNEDLRKEHRVEVLFEQLAVTASAS